MSEIRFTRRFISMNVSVAIFVSLTPFPLTMLDSAFQEKPLNASNWTDLVGQESSFDSVVIFRRVVPWCLFAFLLFGCGPCYSALSSLHSAYFVVPLLPIALLFSLFICPFSWWIIVLILPPSYYNKINYLEYCLFSQIVIVILLLNASRIKLSNKFQR